MLDSIGSGCCGEAIEGARLTGGREAYALQWPSTHSHLYVL